MSFGPTFFFNLIILLAKKKKKKLCGSIFVCAFKEITFKDILCVTAVVFIMGSCI